VGRARATQQPKAVLRFRGAPPGLEALAPSELAPDGVDPATVALKLGRVEQLAPLDVTEVAAGASHLHFSLPDATAPGTYEGRARLGDAEHTLVAEVEPWPFLSFAPPLVRLEAASGEDVEAHVTVLNGGNVAIEIAGAYAFGLFADEGVELAFADAFRDEPGPKPAGRATSATTKPANRFDRFVEGVADQHGGFVRVRVAEGAGVLAPGELRSLGLVFRFPEGLESGGG